MACGPDRASFFKFHPNVLLRVRHFKSCAQGIFPLFFSSLHCARHVGFTTRSNIVKQVQTHEAEGTFTLCCKWWNERFEDTLCWHKQHQGWLFFFCTFGLVLVDTMNVEHKTFMTREKIGCFWVVQEIFFLPQKMIDAKV